MWTTDIVRAVEDDYWGADEPPDMVLCTHQQTARLWGAVPLNLRLVSRASRGRHSRPELFADPDRKGRITP